MALVSIQDLSKSYGNIAAVDGFSLEVEEGIVLGLIGPNGAGKTTIMKVALGLLRPDRGKVEVFGEDPWDNPKIRMRTGIVYEKANLPPHRKVLDYLEKTCRIFGSPESRAQKMLETVGLCESWNRQIRTLSAGMFQKLVIAHSLIHEPELIIADEPTANMDPQARSEFLDLILKLHCEKKTTFLISSHILPELSKVCDSVAIMNKGKLWAQGRLSEIYERFGVTSTRISADRPQALAKALGGLEYVRHVEADARGVSVSVPDEANHQLYEDLLHLAVRLDAKILRIESGTTSLEELFRLALKSEDARHA